MSDINIRIDGRAGRITLNRPDALNALTYEMVLAIEAAIDSWRTADIDLVLIDAAGTRAFCSGGDISDMYASGLRGDFDYGRKFWRDEYRLNAKLFEYPKPVVSFLQGFTMGGGVGVGCHGSHRIVGESSQIAMPECGIGLVPDVGGSLMLALAPGRLGEYLGVTATRMNAADAIFVGFADHFVPEANWDTLKEDLIANGDVSNIPRHDATGGRLAALQPEIDKHFCGDTLRDIVKNLRSEDTEFTASVLKSIGRNAPLAMSCAVQIVRRLRSATSIVQALEMEYRYTFRAMAQGDFIEGIRAAIIDKDRNPKWAHPAPDAVPDIDVVAMIKPLGKDTLNLGDTHMDIGFIGLGNMGGPMASNLAAAGHKVTGFDLSAPMPDGVTPASSAIDAATGRDVVLTMLPNGAILRAVAKDIVPAMKSGAVFLDCSTVDVESARAVATQAETADLMAVDAPVSGGIGGASAGTLTFMAGGSDQGFAAVSPLFDIMGQKAVHCGPSGNGQAAKICNNMILGVTMIGTCEAFALADKLGLDRGKMFDVVSTSSGYSWTMNAYCPAPGVGPQSPADNDYKPGFAADLMLKDLRLSQQAAEAVDADTPMGKAATDLYKTFVEDEDGLGKDFSAMLPRFSSRRRS